MKDDSARLLAIGLGVLLLLVCAWGAWNLHKGSVERANALYRDGNVDQASGLYLERLSADTPDAGLLYNAGTAELILESDSVETLLAAAAQSSDSVIAMRANYNLGYLYMTSVYDGLPVGDAIQLLISSIESSRNALRVDPRYSDARWNLALAQLMLDSISQNFIDRNREQDPGDDPTRIDMESMGRGDGDGRSGIEPADPQQNDNPGQRFAAAQGAREAWASRDPGPLSEGSARGYLADVRPTPEQLVRGLIWAHRPEVAWWNAEPYPGGDQ